MVGAVRSPISRRSVDLPQPDGPMSETNSPWRMVRSTASSAVTEAPVVAKTLPTPLTWTTGAASSAAGSRAWSLVTGAPPPADSGHA